MEPILLTTAMPGSAEYAKATAGKITASKAASILCPGEPGVYGSPFSVWSEMTAAMRGELPKEESDEPEHDDEPEDEDMLGHDTQRADLAWGLSTESLHRDLLRKYAGLAVEEASGTYQCPDIPWLAATPDGWVSEKGSLGTLELKAPTEGGRHLWAGGAPKGYVLQVQLQMRVMKATWGVLSALVPPKPRWERVYASPEMEEWMLSGLTAFYENHVLRDVPPPLDGSEKDLKALRALFPASTSKRIVFSPAAVSAAMDFEEAKDAIKKWEAAKRAAQGVLLQELQDADVGLLPDGMGGYTYKSVVQERQAQPAKTLTVRTLRKVKNP